METSEHRAERAGVGPAVALLYATADDDTRAIRRLRRVYTTQEITDSAVEMMRRLLIQMDVINDREELEDLLTYLRIRCFRHMAVRRVDRMNRWALPNKLAYGFAMENIGYWAANTFNIEHHGTSLGDYWTSYEPRVPLTHRYWVLGLGAALLYFVYDAAETADVSVREVLAGYRAYAAEEYV